MNYPNAEYGIMTSTLDGEEIQTIIAKEYRTAKENVEISKDAKATVRTIFKYSDMEEK